MFRLQSKWRVVIAIWQITNCITMDGCCCREYLTHYFKLCINLWALSSVIKKLAFYSSSQAHKIFPSKFDIILFLMSSRYEGENVMTITAIEMKDHLKSLRWRQKLYIKMNPWRTSKFGRTEWGRIIMIMTISE